MSFTPKSAKNEWDGKTENQQAEEVNVAKAESQAQKGAWESDHRENKYKRRGNPLHPHPTCPVLKTVFFVS